MSRFKFLKGDILNIENRFEMYEGEFLDIKKTIQFLPIFQTVNAMHLKTVMFMYIQNHLIH